MPYCEITGRAQMSKTITAVRHFGLGGRESLETAVQASFQSFTKATTLRDGICQNLSLNLKHFA